ncbi:SDR family NAD(P)-dependent oxidoreductase [Gordonia sp. LSe1-13]|uniref:3-oxoacyl-[acyl-carrier-protein] reductase MabA n=1 Tax=Gordonia sesuvii TaxID=3116777 RepID=A0ABU7MJM5_9ACTN|nr:SDR family NAD(P)-dependent oxidoreductase [Gordonia sp. LSe1-13]
MDYAGQVAILTGAAGGIGQGVARKLVDHGAHVVLVDRDEDKTRALQADLGDQTHCVVVDLTEESAVDSVVDTTMRRYGRVDMLVNNAGTSAHSPMVDVPRHVLDQEIAVHITAPFRLIQRVAIPMTENGYGRIVNISSVAGLMGPLDLSPYGVAKTGLIGVNRAAATELAQHGITVNALALGPIATDLLRSTWPAEQLAARAEHLPIRRLGEVEDVAHAVHFLCHPDSGFITGTVLPIDGGSVAAGAYMVEQFRRWNADT